MNSQVHFISAAERAAMLGGIDTFQRPEHRNTISTPIQRADGYVRKVTRKTIRKIRRQEQIAAIRDWFVFGFSAGTVMCTVIFWLVARGMLL